MATLPRTQTCPNLSNSMGQAYTGRITHQQHASTQNEWPTNPNTTDSWTHSWIHAQTEDANSLSTSMYQLINPNGCTTVAHCHIPSLYSDVLPNHSLKTFKIPLSTTPSPGVREQHLTMSWLVPLSLSAMHPQWSLLHYSSGLFLNDFMRRQMEAEVSSMYLNSSRPPDSLPPYPSLSPHFIVTSALTQLSFSLQKYKGKRLFLYLVLNSAFSLRLHSFALFLHTFTWGSWFLSNFLQNIDESGLSIFAVIWVPFFPFFLTVISK